MPESFLDVVKRTRGDGNYAGDEHGGGGGHEGQGMPTGGPSNFMFATGIECSNPTIDGGRTRRDQLEECGHYERWREDLHLVRELGLKVLRYGLPIHRVSLGAGRYDWSFADEVMGAMRDMQIIPILDPSISAYRTGWGTSRTPISRSCSRITARRWRSATPGCATTRR